MKNYDVFDLWKKFDTINLWPSVDGYKKHCEYGRTNFNWNVFENNLLKVTDYVNTISSTISVYSLLTTPELMAYMKNLNISTYLSIVVAPKHLDIRLLPLDIKNKIIKKFDLLIKKVPFNPTELDNITKTLDYLNKDIENRDVLLKKFKLYNEEVDNLNDTSFIETYPELKEWYERI